MNNKFVSCLIAVLSLMVSSCRTTPTGNQPHLDIVKTVTPSRFSVLISNSTPQTLGIWQGDNSWAWYMLTVYLRERPRGEEFVIRRKDRDWTMNIPGRILLEPGESERMEIDLLDGSWDVPSGLRFTSNYFDVRVRLKIPQTPEAKQLKVFVGESLSDWR
jgi:hypothetical protein